MASNSANSGELFPNSFGSETFFDNKRMSDEALTSETDNEPDTMADSTTNKRFKDLGQTGADTARAPTLTPSPLPPNDSSPNTMQVDGTAIASDSSNVSPIKMIASHHDLNDAVLIERKVSSPHSYENVGADVVVGSEIIHHHHNLEHHRNHDHISPSSSSSSSVSCSVTKGLQKKKYKNGNLDKKQENGKEHANEDNNDVTNQLNKQTDNYVFKVDFDEDNDIFGRKNSDDDDSSEEEYLPTNPLVKRNPLAKKITKVDGDDGEGGDDDDSGSTYESDDSSESSSVENKEDMEQVFQDGPLKFLNQQKEEGKPPREVLDKLGVKLPESIGEQDDDTLWNFIYFEVRSLFKHFYKSMRLSRRNHIASESEENVAKLESVDINGIANYIKSGQCRNIIIVTGAGISTAAGIPDFRSEGTGLYHNLQKYNLPYPQAIFEIDFFQDNPAPFVTLAKELYPGNFKPTMSHFFIRLLSEKGLLLRNFTQNIDTLERQAEIDGDYLVEAHGSFNTAHCINPECKKEYDHEYVRDLIFADYIPTCQECQHLIKPDIVFFGEGLPPRFSRLVAEDFPRCDLLIVAGTSLKVQPFASVVDMVPPSCPRLLLNREVCGKAHPFLRVLGIKSGFEFGYEDNVRDVADLGTCDDGFLKLADLLGWKDELIELTEKAHREFDRRMDNQDRVPRDPSFFEGHVSVSSLVQMLKERDEAEKDQYRQFLIERGVINENDPIPTDPETIAATTGTDASRITGNEAEIATSEIESGQNTIPSPNNNNDNNDGSEKSNTVNSNNTSDNSSSNNTNSFNSNNNNCNNNNDNDNSINSDSSKQAALHSNTKLEDDRINPTDMGNIGIDLGLDNRQQTSSIEDQIVGNGHVVETPGNGNNNNSNDNNHDVIADTNAVNASEKTDSNKMEMD